MTAQVGSRRSATSFCRWSRRASSPPAIYIFITSWNEYLFAMMLSGQSVRTVTVALQLFIGEFTIQWGLLTAGGVLVALPVTILFLLVQRRLVGGLTAGAVKA